MKELEFVPFDEESPEDGTEVMLKVVDPDYEAEFAAYVEELEHNPLAEADVLEMLSSPTLLDSADSLIGADEVCIERPHVTLVVGYPFAGRNAVRVAAASPKGFTRADLFRQIVRVYSTMYGASTQSRAEPLYNTHVESPRFGRRGIASKISPSRA